MPATRTTRAGHTRQRGIDKKPDTANSNLGELPSKDFEPGRYRPLKTEQGVFTTDPYSGYIKPYWRFKDKDTAKESGEAIWRIFGEYKALGDFVGMDIARKFLQMGRTRSLRYALRQGGRKYATSKAEDDEDEDDRDNKDSTTTDRARNKGKKEIPRTGKIYDQGKLDGAQIFEDYWKKCWDDPVYVAKWEEWVVAKL